MRYIYPFLLLVICFCTPAQAQKENAIWYFGEEAGLDFTGGTPRPLLDGVMKAFEGCASIADRNGTLLFYTDGITVWNRNHQPMPNGTGLRSHFSATQAAVIVPQPGSASRYYIFTVDQAEEHTDDGLMYSLVDMNAPSGGGSGDVVTKNVPLLATSTEKITAVKHRNGIDIWLIAHELDSDVFHSYHITPAGITTTPVRSAVGTVYGQGVGYLKASQDGNRLAAAVDFNLFEVYDFNTATGKVSNAIPIPTSVLHWCYGVEFSPDGKLLYGSKAAAGRFVPTEVYQFDLEAGTPAQITASATLVGIVPVTDATTSLLTSAGALQLGPDGRIYLARLYSEYLGVITRPDVRGTNCRYVPDEVHLGTRLSIYGLPTINNTYFRVPEFLFTDLCFGDSTYFSLSPDAFPLDSVLWDFGDPATGNDNTSILQAPAHLFSAPGVYIVTLTLFRGDRADIVSREITIFAPPAPDLGSDTTLCAGTSLVLSARDPAYVSWLWSTGDTTDSIVVTRPGTYSVVVSDGLCTGRDSMIVTVVAPQLAAEGTARICDGQSAQLSVTSDEKLQYHWEPEAGLNNPDIASPVARPATTTAYTVTGTSALGCTTSASVTITVDKPPHVELGSDITTCEGTAVRLDASVTGASWLWSTGETTPVITVTQAGIYSVIVTAGACTVMDAVRVDFSGFKLQVSTGQTICRGGGTLLSAAGAQTYEWSPAAGLDDPTRPDPTAAPEQTTTYRVIGINAQGCRDTAYIAVVVEEPLTVELGKDTVLCSTNAYLLHADVPDAVWLWSTGETTASITVHTTGTYTVTVTRGSCTATDAVTVIVDPVAISVEIPAEICEGDTVRLAATGAESYRWEPADGLNDPAVAAPLAFPTRSTTYTVTGTNTTGCTDMRQVTVSVRPKDNIRLSLPALTKPAGTRNLPVTLTAEVPASELPLTVINLTVELRWDAALFLPLDVSHGQMSNRVEDGNRIVTLSFGNVTFTEVQQVLAEVRGTVMVGEAASTPLSVAGVQAAGCLAVDTRNGSLTTDACFIDGRAVQFFEPTSLTAAPNPSDGEITLRIHSSETGLHNIGVYDLNGRRLWEHIFTGTTNDYLFTVPMGTLPAGLHRAVLTTLSGTWTTTLHVVR